MQEGSSMTITWWDDPLVTIPTASPQGERDEGQCDQCMESMADAGGCAIEVIIDSDHDDALSFCSYVCAAEAMAGHAIVGLGEDEDTLASITDAGWVTTLA